MGECLYNVIEEEFQLGMQPCLSRGFQGGQIIGQGHFTSCTNFDDSCSEDIGVGQEHLCNIRNTITCLGSCSQVEVDSTIASQETTDSSITSQGIENSPTIAQATGDSSTSKKLIELRTQWLNQLP